MGILLRSSAMTIVLAGCWGCSSKPQGQGETASSGTPGVYQSTPIDSLELAVTVEASIQPGEASLARRFLKSSSGVHTATVVTLNRVGNDSVRLIDDVRSAPTVVARRGEHYVLTFRYAPEYGRSLARHEVGELANVATIGTRYGGVLSAMGLDRRSAKVTHVRLLVNGREMLSRDVVGGVGAGGSFEEVSVADGFKAAFAS